MGRGGGEAAVFHSSSGFVSAHALSAVLTSINAAPAGA